MNKILEKDKNQIADLLKSVTKQALNFIEAIDNRFTTSTQTTLKEIEDLTEKGVGTEQSLQDFVQKYDDVLVASTGPRYWGFVTGGSTPAALVGDWLASVYDQNTQSIKGDGDISAQIEFETIAMLLDLFDLPKDFLGGFVTGATMSNFTCLAVARQWLGKQKGFDVAKEGMRTDLSFLSATPHSSAIKSLSMLGVGSNNLVLVNTLDGSREAIDMDDLEAQIQMIETQEFILISSAGTVNTVDFDDFKAIAKLREKYNFWWHIDAAFGGFAACSPRFKSILEGWQDADSITIDCHKWLNVPYESAVYFIKEKHKLLQVATFQNSNAPYLGDPLKTFNYLNFLPENSRRLRALPAWFTLKAYGKEGYREIVERNVELTNNFAKLINNHEAFKVLAPIHLNTACFTLSDENKDSGEFLSRLNKTGVVFMSPTVFAGKKAIRAAFVNWRTTQKDIELAFEEMLKSL
jgi:glutamate/tyrosine decarboxylase-like PLP-dependent enzyme